MALISVSVAHGQTREEARRRLEQAVHEVSHRLGRVERVQWSADASRVELQAMGARVALWVDDRDVHATADLALLGGLMAGPLGAGLKQALQQVFRKQLP